MGAQCQVCGLGEACNGGACAFTGTGYAGSPCTTNNDCVIGGIGGCNTGVTWPGGYCSDSCLFLPCHGSDVCHDHYCYEPCTPPMQGQGTCRSGYVCDSREDDGGFGVQGRCLPDCRAPGLSCNSGFSCSALGYCN